MSIIPTYDLTDDASFESTSMFDSVSSRVRDFIEENPASAVALALVGGLVAGWVLKRR